MAGNDLSLQWTVVGGNKYVVQSASVLAGTSGFTDLSSVITVGGRGESLTNYLDPGRATNSPCTFHRIRLAP